MIERSLAVDSMGKFLTQSLFLEIGYGDTALYTLKDYDCEHGGKSYPSLKRLYLEMEDPLEYEFASTYLLGWKHWQRLCENKAIRKHIDEWRDELEIKLRSRAFKQAQNLAGSGTFQAAKWIADRGWATKGAGRPSKAEVEREKRIQAGIASEYEDDVIRMFQQKQG